MKVETLGDLLEWTRGFHQQLSVNIKDCADYTENIRAKMLLDYLSDHEKQLASVVDGFAHKADIKALNTWCYEYLEKKPISKFCNLGELPFKALNIDDIMTGIVDQHNHVIELYRYLYSRAQVQSTKELLKQLTSLEERHAKLMANSANTIKDI